MLHNQAADVTLRYVTLCKPMNAITQTTSIALQKKKKQLHITFRQQKITV